MKEKQNKGKVPVGEGKQKNNMLLINHTSILELGT